jgi:hypothetical protein
MCGRSLLCECVFVCSIVTSYEETGWMLVKAGPSESRVPPPDFKVYEHADSRDLREGDVIQVTHVNSGKCLSTSPSGRLVVSENNVMDVDQYFYFMLEK